jgi:hypothetical protein
MDAHPGETKTTGAGTTRAYPQSRGIGIDPGSKDVRKKHCINISRRLSKLDDFSSSAAQRGGEPGRDIEDWVRAEKDRSSWP